MGAAAPAATSAATSGATSAATASGAAAISGNAASNTAEEAPAADAEPHFAAMDQIVVPIVGSDHIEGSLRVKLVLAAKDAGSLDRITATMPELRAVSVAESIEFSRLYASPQTPVDAQRLSATLTTALRGANAGIARVLIVEVFARS